MTTTSAEGHGPPAASVDLVIARYNEPLDWVDRLGPSGGEEDRVCWIYNKGLELEEFLPYVTLPNVGREAHTYLHHIADHYGHLADWTVFCQADVERHCTLDELKDLLRPRNHATAPHRTGRKDWHYNGRISHWHPLRAPARAWAGGSSNPTIQQTGQHRGSPVRLAEHSLFDWAWLLLGLDVRQYSGPFCKGATWGVPRQVLLQRPRQHWERLCTALSHDVHPEEAHYLERLWPLVFAANVNTPGPQRGAHHVASN